MQEIQNIPSNDIIIDVDMTTFVAEVIEGSMEKPVLVDFWAPWCEPCKILIPTLEKVINDIAGAVKMAKINIDENQEIATQMQIRSVPTVVLFDKGRPVDAFAGVKSEGEIREFLLKSIPDLGPSDVEQILEQAKHAFDTDQIEMAATLYSQAIQEDAECIEGVAGLALSLLKMGDIENATQILSGVADKNKKHPAITAAQAALDTAIQIGNLGDIDELKAAVDQNSNNHQARFDLALALWAAGQRDEAADQLLYIITVDKEWQDAGARKQLLKFFEMAGPMDPFTLAARRKLSSLLFA